MSKENCCPDCKGLETPRQNIVPDRSSILTHYLFYSQPPISVRASLLLAFIVRSITATFMHIMQQFGDDLAGAQT